MTASDRILQIIKESAQEVRCAQCQYWYKAALNSANRCNNQQSPNAEQHPLASFWCGCGRARLTK